MADGRLSDRAGAHAQYVGIYGICACGGRLPGEGVGEEG